MFQPLEISVDLGRREGAPPVYRQIADQIRADVAAGRLRPGDRLPPIRALARQLGVNRDTVALAYDALAADGMVESTVGRGTFVRAGVVRAGDAPFRPVLAPAVERLLRFERARPNYGAAPDSVPMHAPIPDTSLYPVAEFRRALARTLADAGGDLLRYGGPHGHAGLRAVLAERMSADGIQVEPHELVLCQGASQGISLALRLFAQPGDAIAVEEPCYTNALAALLALGLQAVPVPMTPDGADLGALAAALERPDVKALYTIPTFQNPTGITSSAARRRELLAVARACRVPIVEDASETDLHFGTPPPAPLAALDGGSVVHLSSFSKSLFPGARVGVVAARGAALDGLLALRQATDLSAALPMQAAVAELVRNGSYDRHLGRLRRELRRRCGTLVKTLEDELPAGVRFARPEGGLQLWLELPDPVDTRELLPDALRAGVSFAPGDQFLHDGRRSSGLRLSFAQAGETALRTGAQRLGAVVRARLDARPSPATDVHV